MVELSVILVNWNTRELTLQCLASLDAHPPSRSWEVILVDNGSTDGTADAVRERHQGVRLIRNDALRSFTEANNQAIAASDGRYLLLLNVDTVVHAGTLETTCAYLDGHPEVGAVGCRLLNADGSLQRSAWRGYPGIRHAVTEALYLWRLCPWLVAGREVTLQASSDPVVVDHLLGAYIALPRRVVDRVGAFDTDYYLYMCETDLCRRIQAAGYSIVYLPQATIVHFGQATQRAFPAASLPLFYAGYAVFLRKTGGSFTRLRVWVFKGVATLGIVMRLGLWSVRSLRRPDLGRAMVRGYATVLKRLPGLTVALVGSRAILGGRVF